MSSVRTIRWERLSENISRKMVVPVIGQEVSDPDASFMRKIVQKAVADPVFPKASNGQQFDLAAWTGSITDFGAWVHAAKLDRYVVGECLAAAHSGLLVSTPIPEPLRSLAEMREFNLYLSTSRDDRIVHALRSVRGCEPVLITIRHEPLRHVNGSYRDLPIDWKPSPEQPVVFQLLGHFGYDAPAALTEVDVLECFHQLNEEGRPERLLNHLADKNLLFIGNSLPGWLARFVVRVLKRQPLASSLTTEAISDSLIQGCRDTDNVSFFSAFAGATSLFTDGNASQFVKLLRDNYLAGGSQMPLGNLDARNRERLAPVFLSYTRADLPAVEKIYRKLSAHMEVWFDKNELDPGDRFWSVIEKQIEDCHLFVPVVSRATEARPKGGFIREWRIASQEALNRSRSVPFICPILLDISTKELSRNIPYPQSDAPPHTISAPGGEISDHDLSGIIKSLRKAQSQPSL